MGMELRRDCETISRILLSPVAAISLPRRRRGKAGDRRVILILAGETVSPACRRAIGEWNPGYDLHPQKRQQHWVHENYYRSRVDCDFGRSVSFDAISGTKSS